jgi:hypothetical protein
VSVAALPNNRIFKYELPLEERFTLDIPGLVRVLAVQTQREQPCLWVEVYPMGEKRSHEFRWIETGGEVEWNLPMNYEGTLQLADGRLVFHLYRLLQ